MDQAELNHIKCDACQVKISKIEAKYMPLKTYCSVKRIPLCRECYDKFARKANHKGGLI